MFYAHVQMYRTKLQKQYHNEQIIRLQMNDLKDLC